MRKIILEQSEDAVKLQKLMNTMTWDEIGARLKCTPDAARAKARKLGLRKRILNKASPRRDRILSTHSDKHGVQATALKYNISVDSVKNARKRLRKRRERMREALTGDRYITFRKLCYKAAYENGRGHEAEDFAGWATVEVLERGQRPDVEYLIVDYIRHRLGRNGHRINIENTYSLEKAKKVAMPTVESTDMFCLVKKLDLSRYHRLIFLLYYKEGLSQLDIGKYLNVTESRICQIMGKIQEQLFKLKDDI